MKIMGKYIYIYIYILGIELLFKQGSLRKFHVIGEDILLFSPLKPTTEAAPLLTHQSDGELRDYRSVWMSVGVSSRWQQVIANPCLSNSSLVTSDRKTHNNLFGRNPK